MRSPDSPTLLGREREAEEMLHQQVLRLELAPVLVRDPTDRIIYWNRAAEVMYGFTREEAMGRFSQELLQTEYPEPPERILGQLRSGREWRGELRHLRSGGALIFVAAHWVAHLDERGNLQAIIEVSSDITERKQTEEALARVNSRLKGVIASAMDAIISIDAEQRIVVFNGAAEQMFGLPAAEAMGQSINRLIPERFRQAHPRQIEQFGETGVSTRRMGALGTIRGLRANGEEFPAEASISQGVTGGERIFTVILRDISERQRAEEARARLAAIVESSEDAILSRTLDGVVTSWNAGAERLFGYGAEEMIGQPVSRIIPVICQAQEAEILERLRRGERLEHYETIRKDKNGRLIDVSLTISPIRDAAGSMIAASTIIRDITERRQAEAELRASEHLAHSRLMELEAAMVQLAQAKAELEFRVQERTAELQQKIGELHAFSYSLSHDLRAPVRAIQSFTQIALAEHGASIEPAAAELLQRALSAAQRMDQLIQDVLVLSSLSHQPMALGTVDVEKLVEELLLERPEMQEPAAEITICRPLPQVCGHPASLTQCLANLLSNAVKFVAPGIKPRVRVYGEARGACVRLWVEDNGLGVPPQARGKIFEIFQRFHGGYEGTGIGLAIVRKAVERMGGQAGFESAPGQGSRFWLDLKRA